MDLTYTEQMEKKEREVFALLSSVIRNPGCVYEPMAQSPRSEGYRNKMEYTFGNERKDGPLTVGLHRRKSFHDIIPVTECRIVDEDFRKILSATMDFFGERSVPFFNRKSHLGYLRHLLVRKGAKTGEILVDLVTTWNGRRPRELFSSDRDFPIDKTWVSEEETLLSGYASMLLSLPMEGSLKGVLHTRNDSIADIVCNEETKILFGEDFFYEELLGLRFRITPFSFFQTNSLGAEKLYSVARDYVREALPVSESPGREEAAVNPSEPPLGTVYDLYSGTGTIAQLLSPVASRVVGVEIVPEAIEAAKQNAAENGLSNCTFLAGDVLEALDSIEEKPDFIILDPPRDGVHPKALAKILSYGVPHVVYISCKPSSLARDLVPIQAAGYRVERVRCVDMFPFTKNVETVCLLSQRKPDTTIEVDLDISELEVSSAETKATYEEIKSYVLEKYGLKVSNLYIAQVKRECGIVERINYNLPKTEGNRVPQCPEDKRKAIKDAFVHFQMI